MMCFSNFCAAELQYCTFRGILFTNMQESILQSKHCYALYLSIKLVHSFSTKCIALKSVRKQHSASYEKLEKR